MITLYRVDWNFSSNQILTLSSIESHFISFFVVTIDVFSCAIRVWQKQMELFDLFHSLATNFSNIWYTFFFLIFTDRKCYHGEFGDSEVNLTSKMLMDKSKHALFFFFWIEEKKRRKNETDISYRGCSNSSSEKWPGRLLSGKNNIQRLHPLAPTICRLKWHVLNEPFLWFLLMANQDAHFYFVYFIYFSFQIFFL